MIKKILIVLLISIYGINAQVKTDTISKKYLEDQLFLLLTYNSLVDKPSGLSQNGFSAGFSLGFIKDIPLSQKGNYSIAFGLGYGYDVYIQNLKISNINSSANFEYVTDYKSNSLRLHTVDVPFEFRWRTSSYKKYKFFRVYPGVKFSYVVISKAVYNDSTDFIKTKNIDELDKLKYGLTLSAGYSTWNLYVYYGLNSMFKEGTIENEPLNFKDIKIGLVFYIM